MGLLPDPLSRWIGALRSKLTAKRNREQLDELRARAESASPSYRPQYYLQAAKKAASMQLDAEALELYGCAIDGYLEAGRGRAAEVVCREVIEGYPHVVRARRTLALMALGRGEGDQAAELFREYAEVARQYGDPQLLRKSLRTMGIISESAPIRSQVAEELRSVGDEAGARMVADRGEPEDGELGDTGGSWSRALQAALLGAEDLRDYRAT